MSKIIKIVTVYFEKESISCECICALQDVIEGDSVQVFLNNAPAIGTVKSVKEISLNEMTDAMYKMKSVIKKMPGSQGKPAASVKVEEIVNRNRRITLIGFGIVGDFAFPGDEVAAHNVEVGDVLYFSDSDGTKFRTSVLHLEDSNDFSDCRIHVDAVCKDDKLKQFYEKNQFEKDLNSQDKKIILKSFLINEEEYEIGDWVSHIGQRAFERCRKVKKLIINTESISIEALAFAYNESLEEIVLKDCRASIKVNCFDGCRNLRKVVLPYELYYMRFELREYYGDKIEFSYDMYDNVLLDGVVYTKNMKTLICCVDEDIVEYAAPLNVEGICSYAFKNCYKLKSFIGSPFMKSAAEGVFSGCMSLEKVEYRFENMYDVIFLFGEEFCKDARTETVEYTDGTKRIFYMPQKCEYINLPKPEEVVKVNPKEVPPAICAFLADYFSNIHNTKEAVLFHSIAAMQGYRKSYQKLVEYVQNETIGQEYFSLDLFDYADRTQDIKPFFLMLSRDYPEFGFSELNNKEILAKFTNRDDLVHLLKTISSSSIYDTDVLNVVLNKVYRETEEIHDHEIKKLFLRCANKIGQFDNVLYWMDDLLNEIFVSEADYREFAFNIITINSFIGKPEKEDFLNNMPDSETKDCLRKAYLASQNPGTESGVLFEEFIEKAKATDDVFYQKCALVTIYAYVSLCWREKLYVTEFRKILERILDLYNDGLDLLGFILLSFKQNLKKSITKNFYMECAEKLYDAGILYDNIFDNLLGCNTQNKAAFYAKYPEFFDLADRESVVMKALNDCWFYVYASTVQKPTKEKKTPVMYKNFIPELFDNELVLFLNPHEAVTFMKKNGITLAGDFYRVPIGQVLSIMYTNHLDTVRVFPRTLNQTLTKEYIEHIYDRRY